MARSDEQIRTDVVNQLAWDSRVDASDVSVRVEEAAVTLSGSVPNATARRSAFTDAWAVRGVKSVNNKITVAPPSEAPVPSDETITTNAENALDWNAAIDATDIRVGAESGLVSLNGTVDAYWKKMEAADVVASLVGVIDVENELAVVPTEDTLDKTVAEDVVMALERDALINAENVTVEVENGTVTLSGTVTSWAARRAAYEAALYTTGVVDVRNLLSVLTEPESEPGQAG